MVTTLPRREANHMMNGGVVWLFSLLCSTGAALQMTGPSTYTAKVGSIARIPCTFTADKLPADPRNFAVLWYLEGKQILRYDNTVTSTNPRYSLDEDRAINGFAELTISNTFLSDGGIYTCSVTNSPLATEKNIKVEISDAGLQMMGPSTYTARVGSIARIPCTFTADTLPADPRYFAVLWYLEGKQILRYDNTVTPNNSRYSLDRDRALNGSANLTISDTSVSDGGVYTCSVNYSSFLMEREIRVNISAQPVLTILGKSVQRNTKNTLTCMANGYFPNDITVTWYKEGEVLKDQLMGETLRYDNGTYNVNSTVTITDDQNKTFSCRVQHVSLQEPLQEDFQPTYQESLSRVAIIGIVIAVVIFVIVAAVIGFVLWRRYCWRKAAKENPSDTSIKRKKTPIKPSQSTEKTGIKSPGSPEQPLLTKEDFQSPGQEWRRSFDEQRPNKREESNRTVTQARRSITPKANPNTPEKRQLPDPEIGEITVPELIAGKIATLSCRLRNYIQGVHKFTWYIKVKSTGDVIAANYDGKKHQTIEKDEASDDPNTHITYLALTPVEKSDDESEFILKVELPDRVIERSTGPVHVEGKYQAPLTKGNRKNTLDENIEEENTQCTEYAIAENNNPQSSDQQQTCKSETETLKEGFKEQLQCPVNVEKEDNIDTTLAIDSSSSNPEPGDKEESKNRDNIKAEGLIQNPSHLPYAKENIGESSVKTEQVHKDQS